MMMNNKKKPEHHEVSDDPIMLRDAAVIQEAQLSPRDRAMRRRYYADWLDMI